MTSRSKKTGSRRTLETGRTFLLVAASLAVAAWAPSVHAAGADDALRYDDGALLLKGAATGRARSVWARGKTLVVVLPPKLYSSTSLKVGQDGLKSVKVLPRRNRTDVELRLDKRADRYLGRIELKEQGKDLVVILDKAAHAAAKRRAAEEKAKAAAAAKRAAADAAKVAAAAAAKAATKPAEDAAKADAKPAGGKLGWLKSKKKSGWTVSAGKGKGKGKPDSRMWLLAGLFVIGGGVAWYLRKRGKGGEGKRADIDVVCSRSVGGKQRLMLVEVEGERLLIGATDKELRLLHALGSQASSAAPTDEGDMGFEQLLAAAQAMPSRAPEPRGRFVEQLDNEIARSRPVMSAPTAAVPVTAAEEPPLDEAWAQGIRRLRRARAAQQGESQGFSRMVS